MRRRPEAAGRAIHLFSVLIWKSRSTPERVVAIAKFRAVAARRRKATNLARGLLVTLQVRATGCRATGVRGIGGQP